MTVALYVTDEKDAANMIPWGVRFAIADHSDLLIVRPQKTKGQRKWDALEIGEKEDSQFNQVIFDVIAQQDSTKVVLKEAISSGEETSDHDRILIETRELFAPNPEEAFAEEIESLKVKLLLIPGHDPVNVKKGETTWGQRLFEQAPCETALIRGPAPNPEVPFRILVATEGDGAVDIALRRARKLAKSCEGTVTVLFIRPNDDIVAPRIAEKNVAELIARAPDSAEDYDSIIELAPSMLEGIKQTDLDAYSLVFIGAGRRKTLEKVFRGLEPPLDAPNPYAVIAVREAVPLTTRFASKVKNAVRGVVPQLEREQRVDLVERLEGNSIFNFDFVALISLSTLIAGLGLIQNSAAVVIGAMLVAPLMTPLVGMGFALIQGNEVLLKNGFRSVILGFVVAFLIGAVIGLLVEVDVNSEMDARGHPSLVDLAIAIASGIAGAYAMGRPNLIGALPGVAIAAALVPPLAVSGIAFSTLNFRLSGGSLLLFLTNIVAIVLGTAIVFWAVGINTRTIRTSTGDVKPPLLWPRYWFLAFVLISILLAALMPHFDQPKP